MFPKTLPIVASHLPLLWCLHNIHTQYDSISISYILKWLVLSNYQEPHLATPLYLDTPLEKPLLFLKETKPKSCYLEVVSMVVDYSLFLTICMRDHTFLKWPNTPLLSQIALFRSQSHNQIPVKSNHGVKLISLCYITF